MYEYTRQSFFDLNRDPNVRGLGEWDPSEALALDNDVPDENANLDARSGEVR